jgi:hypothetical protein
MKLIAAAAVGVLIATPAGAVVQAKWKIVGQGTATGAFAVASAQADVKRPLALRVRAVGSGPVQTTIVFSCSRDVTLRPGARVVLGVRRSESCNVVASGSGEGRAGLRIEARRQ